MVIKSKSHHVDDGVGIEVEDFIELFASPANEIWTIQARNLRTGGVGKLRWNALFPVGERETCGCFWNEWKACCKCQYVDFEKSKVS